MNNIELFSHGKNKDRGAGNQVGGGGRGGEEGEGGALPIFSLPLISSHLSAPLLPPDLKKPVHATLPFISLK